MGSARLVCYAASAVIAFAPAQASPDRPPFIRTGQDVIERCHTDTRETQSRCDGMIETLADATEARRWAMHWCPPVVMTGPAGGPISSPLWEVLDQAKLHPEWLKLPATEFVGRAIESARNCPHK